MSKRKRCSDYVAWDEQIVCAERGRRIVHYHMKDGSGNSMLAIVGIERSIRHMWYVPTDELLWAFGTGGVINGNKQWRSRREVVALLASLVSNTKAESSNDDLEASLKVNVPRTVKSQRLEIVWSGDAWFCAKKLKHYPSFSIHGVKIAVHSFVSILTEEGRFYIGYLEDLYEDKKGMEKVRVRWFINNPDNKKLVSQLKPHQKEVLITPYVQVIGAKCVIGQATVLTPRDYEKILAFATQTSSAGIAICYRQVKDNKVAPFALSKLRGYLNQEIFSLLYRNYSICQGNPISSELNMEDDEDLIYDYTLTENAGTDEFRNWEVIQGYGCPDFRPSIPQTQAVKSGPTYPGLKFKMSKIMNKSLQRSEPKVSFPSEVNLKIELLCEDSGIRGCWFRCQIMQRSDKRFQVKYNDLLDVDESGNLEEWVPAVKIAPLDKLGIRCPGRSVIRPPPPKDAINAKFEVGMPVDAWWCDGWWEGVVTQIDSSQPSNLVIYFPGEDKFMRFQRKYVRISRDWVSNRWVDLKPKPEILTFLTANPCNTFPSSLCSIVRCPHEEMPSIPGKDVLSPSKEGFDHLTKNRVVVDETRCDDGGDPATCSSCGEKS